MSHMICISTRIRDLKAAALAAKRMGGTLDVNKKTFEWYSRWLDDYSKEDAAYKQGIKTEDYGKCDACINFPGINYGVGLVKTEEGDYKIVFDFFDSALKEKMGGQGGEAFIQAYAAEVVKLQASKRGQKYTEKTAADGSIIIHITGA